MKVLQFPRLLEEHATYREMGQRLIDKWQPVNPAEFEIVRRLQEYQWRIIGLVTAETSLYALGIYDGLAHFEGTEEERQVQAGLAQASAFCEHAKKFDFISRREHACRREVERLEAQLKALLWMRPGPRPSRIGG